MYHKNTLTSHMPKLNIYEEIDVIENMKKYIEFLFDSSLAEFKDRISAGVFSLELSILYNNKVYDQGVNDLQDVFLKLSNDIDDSLNHHAGKCIEEILGLFDNINFNPVVSKVLGINKVTS